MFTAKVYRIMVGSLSGAMEEVYVAKETIRMWNQQNAERTGKVFMPIEWSTSQEAIQNTDIVVGLVDNWIGDTKIVEDCNDAGKQVMLLFSILQDSDNTIQRELDEVKCFQSKMQEKCFCASYDKASDLGQILSEGFEAV